MTLRIPKIRYDTMDGDTTIGAVRKIFMESSDIPGWEQVDVDRRRVIIDNAMYLCTYKYKTWLGFYAYAYDDILQTIKKITVFPNEERQVSGGC